jgi:Ca-activated chloride channel homolog
MIPLLSFLAPVRLWLLLLIPLLVLLYLWMVQRKRNRSRQVSQTMFDLVIPRDRTWLRHLAVGLSILSLLTLTVAFAKPKDQVSVPRERATVVVTVDVSLSMEAKDVEPNRLDAAKDGAEQFVNSLPPKFNVALVTFAGTATTLVPPTMEHGAVTAAIGPNSSGSERSQSTDDAQEDHDRDHEVVKEKEDQEQMQPLRRCRMTICGGGSRVGL